MRTGLWRGRGEGEGGGSLAGRFPQVGSVMQVGPVGGMMNGGGVGGGIFQTPMGPAVMTPNGPMPPAMAAQMFGMGAAPGAMGAAPGAMGGANGGFAGGGAPGGAGGAADFGAF